MNTNTPKKNSGALAFASLLAAVLFALFWKSFLPGVVHFSNDGPLGVQNSDFLDLPGGVAGIWADLNSLGLPAGAFSFNITMLLKWILGPVGYSKFLAPISLFILGFGAWALFRQLRLSPVACALGGVAAALGTTFFTAATWGVASQEVAMGMNFLSLAMVVSASRTKELLPQLARLALAGAAIGMSIMEGLDNGALFSLFIAAFTVYLALNSNDGSVGIRLGKGLARTAVIAICAALVAAQALFALVTTQIQGVAGMGQDERTKQEQWDWATQWSLQKREALALIVPGLFGYRMDTPDGGNYWGAMGRSPSLDRYLDEGSQGPRPANTTMRFTGGSNYLGIGVALIAFWAAFHSFRRKDSAFDVSDRRLMWFWCIAAVVAFLISLGRFAPFYGILYQVPYFSTIRSPTKFLAVLAFAVTILFAYGVNGLWKRYVQFPNSASGARPPKSPADRRWLTIAFALLGLSVIGWVVYGASAAKLREYLQTVDFDEGQAREMAAFSLRQVGWFVVLLAAAVATVYAIINGKFTGQKARWAAIILGVVVIGDLVRANVPWTVFWDYEQKYASNPIIEKLREKPYEQRVAYLPFRSPPEFGTFEQLYRIEWAQHHFPYFNIQSLDVVQMPRPPADLVAFETALNFRGQDDLLYLIPRRWALTSTRYLLGPAGFIQVLNSQLDPEKQRFRIAAAFDLAAKPGVAQPKKLEELTVNPNPNGKLALFEFTGALPRAKLYSQWLVPSTQPEKLASLTNLPPASSEFEQLRSLGTNDFLTLQTLAARDFDPTKLVLVSDQKPLPAPTASTNQSSGTVEYVSYAPKDIRLKTQSDVPTVLLLNDKYDANWTVTVDGKPAELLRCNYIMRGVHLPPGTHEVQFTFRMNLKPLYLTLASLCVVVLLIGYVAVSGWRVGEGEL